VQEELNAMAEGSGGDDDDLPNTLFNPAPSFPVSLLRSFHTFSLSTDSTRDYPEPILSLINILISNESFFLKMSYQRCSQHQETTANLDSTGKDQTRNC